MYIIDFEGKRTEVGIDLTSDVYTDAWIHVLSGDEVLHVVSTDGKETIFDSCDSRTCDLDPFAYWIKRNGKMEPAWYYPEFHNRRKNEWHWDWDSDCVCVCNVKTKWNGYHYDDDDNDDDDDNNYELS